MDESINTTNRDRPRLRAKVEHVFGVIKTVFGFQKVCYWRLGKSHHRLEVAAALASVDIVQTAECVG